MKGWLNTSLLSMLFFLSDVSSPWNKWEQLRSHSKCFVQWSIVRLPHTDMPSLNIQPLSGGSGVSVQCFHHSCMEGVVQLLPSHLSSQARSWQWAGSGIRVARSDFLESNCGRRNELHNTVWLKEEYEWTDFLRFCMLLVCFSCWTQYRFLWCSSS